MNQRRVIIYFWIFLLFLLQNSADFLFSTQPFPFLLLGLVYFALQEGPAFGAFLGCLTGVFFEIYGSGPIGAQMFLMATVGFFCGWVGVKIFKDNWFVQVALAVTSYFFYELSNAAIARVNSGDPLGFSLVWSVLAGRHLAVTALGSPLVFVILKRTSGTKRFSTPSWRL